MSLRELRNAARPKPSQDSCGTALGITCQGYSAIERGVRPLRGSPAGLLKLADLLKVSIWDLTNAAGESYTPPGPMTAIQLLSVCPVCGMGDDFDATVKLRGGKMSTAYACHCGFSGGIA